MEEKSSVIVKYWWTSIMAKRIISGLEKNEIGLAHDTGDKVQLLSKKESIWEIQRIFGFNEEYLMRNPPISEKSTRKRKGRKQNEKRKSS